MRLKTSVPEISFRFRNCAIALLGTLVMFAAGLALAQSHPEVQERAGELTSTASGSRQTPWSSGHLAMSFRLRPERPFVDPVFEDQRASSPKLLNNSFYPLFGVDLAIGQTRSSVMSKFANAKWVEEYGRVFATAPVKFLKKFDGDLTVSIEEDKVTRFQFISTKFFRDSEKVVFAGNDVQYPTPRLVESSAYRSAAQLCDTYDHISADLDRELGAIKQVLVPKTLYDSSEFFKKDPQSSRSFEPYGAVWEHEYIFSEMPFFISLDSVGWGKLDRVTRSDAGMHIVFRQCSMVIFAGPKATPYLKRALR